MVVIIHHCFFSLFSLLDTLINISLRDEIGVHWQTVSMAHVPLLEQRLRQVYIVRLWGFALQFSPWQTEAARCSELAQASREEKLSSELRLRG